MVDISEEANVSEVHTNPLRESTKYNSPIPSNSTIYDPRLMNCKCKELKEQSSVTKAKLHVVTTNRRVRVFGKWSENKLLVAVTDRLLQRATSKPLGFYERIPPAELKPLFLVTPYHPIIHRGIYGEKVLQQLYNSGTPEDVVIRAMKFGLRHVKPEYLNYFVQFGLSIPVLKSHKLWGELVDQSLVTSLRTMGFDERDSRKIILNGMLAQQESELMHLMLAGVDVPGILNWQGATIEVGSRLIQFLRKLGAQEDVLQLVVQKGIDEETYEMLNDLGYIENEDEEHSGMHEVVICECDLTILESSASLTCDNYISETSTVKRDYIKTKMEAYESCTCFNSISSTTKSNSESSTSSLMDCDVLYPKGNSLADSELLVDRNEYLRRTVMTPLAWAMAKALQYRPTDPKYYIACQLLRWKSGAVCKTEMKEAEEFIIRKTIEMDKKCTDQKRQKEKEVAAKHEVEVLQNIPCHSCLQRQQIHRVKERCWKCIRKLVPNYEPCDFPQACSSCKVDLSDISNSDMSTTSTEKVSIDSNTPEVDKSISEERKSLIGSCQYSDTEGIEEQIYNRHYVSYEQLYDSTFEGQNISDDTIDVSADLNNYVQPKMHDSGSQDTAH